MKIDCQKNICGIDFINSEIFIGKNLEQVIAGQKLTQKLFLRLVSIIVVSLSSIVPFFSAILLEYCFLLNNIETYGLTLTVIIASLAVILYFLAIAIIIIRGFESSSITTVLVLIAISALISFFTPKIGIVALVLCFNLSIAFGWLGITILGFFLAFSHFAGGLLCQLTGLILSTVIATHFTFFLKNIHLKHHILIITYVIIFFGVIIARQAIKGSPKFAWIREKAVFWAATGGTSFYGVDLTDACFDNAHLPHTDFRKANLTRTSFENVRGLEFSRLQGTILENPKVRKLLIKKEGYAQDYTGANLSGANLKNADLTKAYLNEVNALDADFSGAILTGACIQAWNINKNTRFTNVKCTHIFLKCTRDNNIIRLEERKPDSGEFKPGEFEKWIGEIQNTVDLIFRQGLNWRAFIFSLTQTAINHDGLDLSRYSITRKDETLVFAKIGVFPDANHSAIHQSFTTCYANTLNLLEANIPLVLQAKDGEIQRLREIIASNYQIIKELASVVAGTGRQVLIQGEGNRVYMLNQGEIMESKNEGISIGGNVGGNLDTGDKISAGGDMNLTASSLTGALNNVTNTIQQLSDVKTDSSDELAKILTILQKSIADDAALSDSQKQDALEAVETIAEEGKKPQEKRTPKFCKMALNALSGVTSAVTDASKLAEVLKTYLPTLTKILGM